MRTAYNGLKDSLSNSAWADSVGKWQNALTNNGVISGAGADDCPGGAYAYLGCPFGRGDCKCRAHLGNIFARRLRAA